MLAQMRAVIFVFYDKFKYLCEKNNTTVTATTLKLGFSKGNIKYWRDGKTPTGDALLKIANHFDCSVDYLLGRTDNPEFNR